MEEVVFQSRAELFDCGFANDMSKVTHIFVCIMSTPCFCFAQFSYVALDHLIINFAWLCQRLVSLSFEKTTVHINFVLLDIDVCVLSLFVDFVRYLTFSHHRIQI